MNLDHYKLLAGLFDYPRAGFAGRVAEVQAFLDERYPQAGEMLLEFTGLVGRLEISQLEELFCRSFEVQAATTLDLGYVLFGDDYKRGALLVNLNSEHREAGIDCGVELGDHLPNVLRLIGSIKKPEVLNELVEIIVQPALRKIMMDFEPEMIERKSNVYMRHHATMIERPENYGLIYLRPIEAVLSVLESDFHVRRIMPAEKTSDFLRNVAQEIEIEPF